MLEEIYHQWRTSDLSPLREPPFDLSHVLACDPQRERECAVPPLTYQNQPNTRTDSWDVFDVGEQSLVKTWSYLNGIKDQVNAVFSVEHSPACFPLWENQLTGKTQWLLPATVELQDACFNAWTDICHGSIEEENVIWSFWSWKLYRFGMKPQSHAVRSSDPPIKCHDFLLP